MSAPGSSKPLVALIAGTRPEVIKLAPVVRALPRDLVDVRVVAVDQQVDLVGSHLLEELLERGWTHWEEVRLERTAGTLSELLGRAVEALDNWITLRKPALVMVQGDTTTALAGALAAFHRGVPVAHVEAGLRSGVMDRPFPEEANRQLISRLCHLNFAPTERAASNLSIEQVPGEIHVTGNTVVDDLLRLLGEPMPPADKIPNVVPLANAVKPMTDRRIVLVTCHRREGWDSYLPALVDALVMVGGLAWWTAWPVHPNPLVRAKVRALNDVDHVFLCDPVSRRSFAHLLDISDVVMTDSGGVIEEAVTLGKPVLILREETERSEALQTGLASLVSVEELRAGKLIELLEEAAQREPVPEYAQTFGDGRAGVRIAREVVRFLLGEQAADPARERHEDVSAPAAQRIPEA